MLDTVEIQACEKLSRIYEIARKIGMYGAFATMATFILGLQQDISELVFYGTLGLVIATPMLRTIYLAIFFKKNGSQRYFWYSSITAILFILLISLKLIKLF